MYSFFHDPVAFSNCLDDPHEFHTVDPEHFEGSLTAGVGFIHGTFRLRGSYSDEVPEKSLKVHLAGTGMGSGLDGAVTIDFGPAPEGTSVSWAGDINLSGPVATLGERMVRGTVDKKSEALFAKARATLETGSAATP